MSTEKIPENVRAALQAVGSNEYRCAACHNVYAFAWTQEEAAAETALLFPGAVARGEPMAVICDDCFNAIRPRRPQP